MKQASKKIQKIHLSILTITFSLKIKILKIIMKLITLYKLFLATLP